MSDELEIRAGGFQRLFTGSGGRIRHRYHLESVFDGVTEVGLDAEVRTHAGQHQRIDAALSELNLDVVAPEAGLVVSAAVLVVVVRAATIYPLVWATNLVGDRPIPVHCQHVMVWGGLHTVVPIALVLSLPEGFPFREELQVMVFGIAVISIGVQGLLMPVVLTRLGMGDSSGA